MSNSANLNNTYFDIENKREIFEYFLYYLNK